MKVEENKCEEDVKKGENREEEVKKDMEDDDYFMKLRFGVEYKERGNERDEEYSGSIMNTCSSRHHEIEE